MEEFADKDAARNVWEVYEFRIEGMDFWVDVADGQVTIRPGHAPRNADLLVETDLETFMGIGFGAIRPEDATESGRTYPLARNEMNTGTAEKPEYSEFTGPTFSSDGKVLFVNIQTPGITLAITGPWEKYLR